MGTGFFNKFKEKVRKQKTLIDSLKDKRDDQSVKVFVEARDPLNEILLHEEIHWKQCAKLFWLKEGDVNTKFFTLLSMRVKKRIVSTSCC